MENNWMVFQYSWGKQRKNRQKRQNNCQKMWQKVFWMPIDGAYLEVFWFGFGWLWMDRLRRFYGCLLDLIIFWQLFWRFWLFFLCFPHLYWNTIHFFSIFPSSKFSSSGDSTCTALTRPNRPKRVCSFGYCFTGKLVYLLAHSLVW